MLNWLNKMMRKKPLANLLKKAETARKVAQSNKRELLEWLEKGKTETPIEGTPAYFEQQVGSILGYYSIPEDWPHWAGKPTLVADEAIPLMNGLDPGSWRNRDKRMPPEQPLPDDMVSEITRGLQIAEAGGLKAKSPTEWLAWGRSHGLDKPTMKSDQRLREPDICMWQLFAQAVAEVERKAQKEAEYRRRLSQDCIALSQSPLNLDYWLIHDKWTQEEGLTLLLGLDPRETKISPSIFFNNTHPKGLEEFEFAKFFNGKYIDSTLDDIAQADKRLMLQLSKRYQDMKKIWVSGNYSALNTPEFFVEWAISKGFNIPPELSELTKGETADANAVLAKFSEAVNQSEKQKPKISTVEQSQRKTPEVKTPSIQCEAGNPATRLIEEVIETMTKDSRRVTLSTIWVELGKLSGKSIIVDSQPNRFICDIGESDPHHITTGSVRGILARWRTRQKHT